jgi:hypothetical protein
MKDGFNLIYRYSRSDAIRDGVLIDVSETAREANIQYPTAITQAVHAAHVRVPDGVVEQDERGRLWDILFMLYFAITRAPEGDTLLYTVFVRSDNDEPKPVKLKAICHPGDSGEPVVTVMLPDED